MPREHAGPVVLPAGDGVVTLRAFVAADRPVVLAGRDEQWQRWLGPGSPDPSPTACIEVGGVVVGWIDADLTPPWLHPGEANIGYSVFAVHRGNGYAARAMRLLATELVERGVRRALLVVDARNRASVGVARDAGAHLLELRSIPEVPSSDVYALELAPGASDSDQPHHTTSARPPDA